MDSLYYASHSRFIKFAVSIQQKQRKMQAQQLTLTTLPQPIIETILCLVPIEEAARTSVLSREWRYKWTTIPKLEFYQEDVKQPSNTGSVSNFQSARKKIDMRRKLLYIVHQVLLFRQGLIHDFTLSLDTPHTFYEIDQIILHLSRNHAVKRLAFDFCYYNTCGLPLSFFSLHHLTELYLDRCNINQKPIFNGFVSLTKLSYIRGKISGKALLHLLSNCPSLKSLELLIYEDHFLYSDYPSIMELFKCLPVIEHLTIWGCITSPLVYASVQQVLPTSLIHLKYCRIVDMYFDGGNELPFLATLIKCSPNLEKIELNMGREDPESDDEIEEREVLKKYSNVWLEHLNVLEIENFKIVKLVSEFVKFILARSPNLKKVRLTTSTVSENEKLEMLNTLLRAPHASTVEIVVR